MKTFEHSAMIENTSSHFFVRSETNGRENNEDSFLTYQIKLASGDVTVLSIADGMGGHAYGEHVSREALRKVSMALFEQLCVNPALNSVERSSAFDVTTIEQAVWNAIEQANTYVRRMVEVNKWGKAGSTIVIAVLFNDIAVVANLGDSPLFHFEQSKRALKQVTDNHTVAGVLLRAGMITPEMALHHEGRSRLEFFIGAEKLPRKAPVSILTIAPDDLLLLCTDGVSSSLLQEQMEQIVATNSHNLAQVAQQLFEAARKEGETDNQTLILWRQVQPVTSDQTQLVASNTEHAESPHDEKVIRVEQQVCSDTPENKPVWEQSTVYASVDALKPSVDRSATGSSQQNEHTERKGE